MSFSIKNIFIVLGSCLSFIAWFSSAKSIQKHRHSNYYNSNYAFPPEDSAKAKKKNKKSEKSVDDRYGDPFSNKTSKSPLLLNNPANISTIVELDSNQENFTIKEKVGESDFRTPSTMTYEEYSKYQEQESIKSYWKSKQNGGVAASKEGVNIKNALKTLRIPIKGLEGPFGSNFVDIKPNGLVTLDFSGRWQRVNNPIIPVRQQRNGGFEFDQQISMNLVGKIGEKLKLTANWDTKAAFEFQNNIKLEYSGLETDILQKIEAGFVNMPVNSSLITGAQNLFGIKTKLQFGRMSVTAVMSSQRGKVDEIRMPAGSQARDFEVRADAYDENRHFFLGQFFRNNYENALKGYPALTSGVKVTKVNVYVTNRVNNTQFNKNVVAYMDLGESQPYRKFLQVPNALPNAPTRDSAMNRLSYPDLKSFDVLGKSADVRDHTLIPDYLRRTILSKFSEEAACDTCFQNGIDYLVTTSARMLQPTEYTFNPDLGYISLNSPLTGQDMLAVAYEYSFRGQTGSVNYKVGEVVGDRLVTDSAGKTSEAIVLKLLKPVGTFTNLPTWGLMMKNIYSLGATQVSRENFLLRVIYKDDRTGLDVPYFQDLQNTEKRVSILRALGIDRLGPNNDPPADGNFDFVEGITIDPRFGRVIFPVLEPFGSNMQNNVLKGEPEEIINKYVFSELYTKQLGDVRQYAGKNKFFLKGRMQSSSTSDIPLQGINIAPGSVQVYAGSNLLAENVDYQVDYGSSRVKILNQGILASGQEIRVKYEKQDLFNFRRKTFLGTRLDYKLNNDVNFGGTFLHQTESPQITRTNVGDEPSSNSIWGLDMNFKKESRFITKMLDKLPLLETKEPTQITFAGEVAQLIPGYPKVIDKGENGTSFIDDFEGAETPFDLTNNPSRWRLSTTPKITNSMLSPSELQELDLDFNAPNQSLRYYHHRAKLAWYNIDNSFYTSSGGNIPASISAKDKENIFIKQIQAREIFPQQDQFLGQPPLPTLDLAYFPAQRGAYNFNPNLNSRGEFNFNRRMSWAGITRDLRNDIDFDNANIQYLEFWVMNPFYDASKIQDDKYKIPINLVEEDSKPTMPAELKNKVPDPVKSSGKLYINLGEISEDVMKDGLNMFENGLPYDDASRVKGPVRETNWGKVPTTQFITNAFPAIDGARSLQDVGLDGLTNAEETLKFQEYVNTVSNLITDPVLRQTFLNDPSGDDFKYYLGEDLDQQRKSILQRYLNFSGTENNSPASTINAFTPASTFTPDMEDLNQDNTINTSNNYYEYEIDIDPNKFNIGASEYIIAKQLNSETNVEYLQFRIPIRGKSTKVGAIEGFKSIRFIRMYLSGFEEPIVLRFAKFQLVANQWRAFQTPTSRNVIEEGVKAIPDKIDVSTVNVEENSTGVLNKTSSYIVPPGFSRDQDITSQNNRRLNEQSLRLCLDETIGLAGGRIASAFKNVNVDMLNYGRLRMFVHAESTDPEDIRKNLKAFIRLGTDFTDNYYDIELPLTFSNLNNLNPTAEEVWPSGNHLNINLKGLPELKSQRNGQGGAFNVPYKGLVDGKVVSVKGNPDLSSVQVIMLGMTNSGRFDADPPVSGCIWVNELRLTDFVQEGGWATTARLNVKLADVANIASTMRFVGVGFGSIDQKVSQRQRVNTLEWGVQGNMGLDRFIPQKVGLRLPLFASYNTKVISPRYNPLDPDVLLATSLKNIPDPAQREAYRKIVVDEQIIKGINLTNVQKVKTRPDSKSHFYDIENISLSVGYNITTRTNSSIYDFYNKLYTGGVGYSFTNPAKPFEPFKNAKFLNSKYLKLIKDINFSFLPNTINVRSDFNRRLTKTQFYEGNPLDGILQDPFYEKAFTNVRTYGLVWSFTKSITLNYTANTNAIIDEPFSSPDSAGYNKALWNKVKRLGRTKNYTHSINATYKVPFDKLPLTEWLNTDLAYAGTYNWVAGANAQRDTMGNLVTQNTRDMSVNGNISLDRIYNKSKYLREILNPPPKPEKKPVPTNTDPKADTTKKEEPKREYLALKGILRLAMSAKRITLTYKITEGTKLPGYKGTANIFGLDRNQGSDLMLPFVLGWQDYSLLRKLASANLISDRPSLTDQFTYSHRESFSAQTTLDPIRDFNITLKLTREKTNNYSELFYFNKAKNEFETANPLITGNYNISMIFLGTAFKGPVSGSDDPTSSQTFQDFENNRRIIKERKITETGNVLQDSLLGLNSQDILVPTFLATYRGMDINKASLNPYPAIPLPNWGVNYTGLNKLKFFKKWFQSINITHNYNATYSVSSFTSSNLYGSRSINPQTDPSRMPLPSISRGGNYVPVFTMDIVTIKESFSPLIGINLRTKGKATYNIQLLRDRGLTLSMTNAQIQEVRSQGITVGFGWNKTGLKFPFKWQGRQIPPLKNELTFKADLTIRDNLTIQRNINGASTITAGVITVQIRPTISYMISQRVTLMFYFDRNVNIPRISSQFRRGVTQFGLQLRFTLS
ncbi:MAG: cell surface protein SprA [Cytophagales bacterium]|nr:MAG: cell surface protein SprA [Cytophagales bacterium]